MKLLLYLLMLTSSSFAVGQAVDQIENRRLEALQQGDYEFVQHLLAPQFVTTRLDGAVLNRDEYIEKLKSGQLKLGNVHHSDVHVHEFGNTSVITGLSIAELHDSAGDRTVKTRYTHTLCQEWRPMAAARHAHQSIRPLITYRKEMHFFLTLPLRLLTMRAGLRQRGSGTRCGRGPSKC